MVAKNYAISKHYAGRFIYAGTSIIGLDLLDSFLNHDYIPYGKWEGFYENGKLALECKLNIYNYGKFSIKEGNPEAYNFIGTASGPEGRLSSIKEALNTYDCYFKPGFSGSFKLYNRDGKIIKEENFRN